jgi:hypothetical protein
VKLRRVRDFDDHKLASFCRDSGSASAAESLLRDFRERCGARAVSDALRVVPAKARELHSASRLSPLLDVSAELIRVRGPRACRFRVFSDSLHIDVRGGRTHRLDDRNLRLALFRQIMHRPDALELYTDMGETFLVRLPTYNSLSVLRLIASAGAFPNAVVQTSVPPEFLPRTTAQWVRGDLSNFEYLLCLNRASGRSFNDPAMYPIVPWVLASYDAPALDLADGGAFRDLSRPVGALNAERLAFLQAKRGGLAECGSPPYLYGSGHVSPLTLFNWLIRLEPFTSLHIESQSGRFDHASRVFASVRSAFKMAMTAVNDYVELIPEFFACPAFLSNVNDYDLGVFRERRIGDVELPPWAQTPVEFVYRHREALESQNVTANLHAWIDLVWGCRQEGDPINEFHPYMYESVWSRDGADDDREAIESFMQQCGQIPIRLFDAPHPRAMPHQSQSQGQSQQTVVIRGAGDAGVVRAAVAARSDAEIAFYAVAEGGAVWRLRFTVKTARVAREAVLSLEPFTAVAVVGRMVVTGAANGQAAVVDLATHERTKLAAHIGRVNCIAADQRFLVTGGADTSTVIHDAEPPHARAFAVPSYGGEVIAVDVCTEFGAVVSGTRDGAVLIFSLTSRTVVHVLALESRVPERIMISRKWGFIVVYETEIRGGELVRYIEVFTINGGFVRREKIAFEVALWCTFTNKKGFDFAVATDPKGALYLFEVFYINLEKPFYRCGEQLAELTYLQEAAAVVALSCNGGCFFIPLQVNQ